jgi:hypothetical protein
MTQVTWKIVNLERQTSDGFVTTAHWTCTAQDGEFSASSYGSCGFTGDLTKPYANLTEADVLAWVWESVDKEATETALDSQIEAQKNPVKASGLPWVQQ